ncbi:GT2 family glycosyltransferase [Catalinimonas alkaloidigena]|uniref:glycosyltransferase family 2 protein n=1 Tax=Catalinimonas alkaloidigena TaxID=1075417 RepID=UPI002404CD40|nr:glycosyltransferase family 2 protein [Catalinimonas alkaloidigena]MDF9795853.1 GT2 family glycosyltransferase [Catalinimonas alkaloidigena]
MEQAAVIILNYNGLHFLKQFLPSVIKYSRGHRLIVADNGSTDDSLTYLKAHFPEVEIIAFQENHGFAKGYDLALSQISNKYSILLNSDVEVTENWINPIIEFMESDEKIAACQPKIRAYHQKDSFEHAGAAGGFIDLIAYPFCRGRILDTLEKDHGQYDDVKQIFWATGACFFARTEVYKQLGGFDDIFHAHMEEIDLCWRINASGYKIFYHPASTVYHVGGGTMPVTNPKKTYLNFRNSTGMLFKNTPLSRVWWKIPVKIMVDTVAALKFFLDGKIKDGKAVMLANAHFLLNLKRWNKRRAIVKKLHSVETKEIVYPRLLVFERYLKKKKLFSQLNF